MQKPVKYYGITQPFKKGIHYGIDLGWSKSSGHNQPIYAIEDGVVIYKATQKTGGNVLHIRHNNGFVSEYAHLNSWLVSINDKVRKGQQIGTMGATGMVSGEHLHLGLYQGTSIDYSKMGGFVDPAPYIIENWKEATVKEVVTQYITYTIVKGDTLSKIAFRYGTSISELVSINGIKDPNKIIAGSKIKIPKKGIETYTIVKGDTLTKIASKFNTTIEELVKINNISDPNKIVADNKLRIK